MSYFWGRKYSCFVTHQVSDTFLTIPKILKVFKIMGRINAIL